MMELVEFLRARLDEDEAVALKSSSQDVSRWDYLLWARFSQARVLADVKSKRRIVDMFERAYNDDGSDGTVIEQTRRALQDVAELLAVPYSNHPDFDEEWWM